jgi:hypothetical protein
VKWPGSAGHGRFSRRMTHFVSIVCV